jgi:hypothetical protein
MGLDQWACKTKDERASGAFQIPSDLVSEEIAAWRKHPNLHGWMRDLYVAKNNGTLRVDGKELPKEEVSDHRTFMGEEFNCDVGVELTLDDLVALAVAVETNALPETSGFFFGQSSTEDAEDDRRFIRVAREAITEGFRVYYSSWWIWLLAVPTLLRWAIQA